MNLFHSSVSWNADDLDSTLMKFEDGVDLALSRAKAWAKYAKDVATYVEKRAQMGKDDGIGCRYLTQWGQDKVTPVSQTTPSNAFTWMKIFEFTLKFHWSLFLWIQLTISQHWFR